MPSSRPARSYRLLLASALASAAFAIVYASALQGSIRTDFSLTWFGATALLNGANPFALVGPGMIFDSAWPALYPATAYVIGIPFAFLPEHLASAVFVGLSTFALAYGSTRDSWHRLPMFASVAFLSSAHLAQWSILFTAALFIPWLAVVLPAKPQLAIPILAGAPSRRRLSIAAGAFTAIFAMSLILVPSWPREWFDLARTADQLVPPVLRPGGFVLLLVLLRWKRPEAWLVALIAAMPQTSYPYNILPLLAIAATYREACFLSIASSVGALAAIYLVDAVGTPAAIAASSALMIGLGYVPATIVVLRRPNENPRLAPSAGFENPLMALSNERQPRSIRA